jgi:hypothetical protein
VTLSRAPAAVLALAVAGGCSSPPQVVLTIQGEASGAVALFVRLVDQAGPRQEVRSVGDADHPVTLPATVYLQLANTARIGVAVWVADGGGTIVAQAMTPSCVSTASASYAVTLAPAPDGWSPGSIDRCRCEGETLRCLAAALPDGGAPEDAGPEDVVSLDAGEDARAEVGEAPADAAADAGPEVSSPPDGPPSDARPDAHADGSVDAAVDAVRPDAAPDAPAKPDVAVDRARDTEAPPTTSPVAVPTDLFGFELAGPDWSSAESTLKRDTSRHTQGAASLDLTVPATGTATLKSRSFSTTELGLGSNLHMSVDLFVGAKQTGNANMEMWVDCQSAGVYGVYMGYRALSALKVGGWTPLAYNLPGPVASAFAGKFTDCQVWFQIVGTGTFGYDRMGFVP